MNPLTARRRIARDLARAGVAVSAAMFAVSLATSFGHEARVSAATNAGSLSVQVATGATAGSPLTSGGSATQFALRPPSGAACTGDSASGNYRVQSYMVPATVNPATLTFDAGGPAPQGTGSAYRQPLFSNGTPFVNKLTGVATTANGPGLLVNLPPFDFTLFGADGPTLVPAGTYNLGYACTVGTGASQVLDKYWNVQFTISANPADSPSKLSWVVAGTTTPTTTTTTAPPLSNPTTTTAPGSSTTTATTTADTDPATSDTLDATVTTAVGSGGPSGGGSLVVTGSSPWPVAIWGFLLLVFGRMAVLCARPVRVITSDR